jgi:hypothetical protein
LIKEQTYAKKTALKKPISSYLEMLILFLNFNKDSYNSLAWISALPTLAWWCAVRKIFITFNYIIYIGEEYVKS